MRSSAPIRIEGIPVGRTGSSRSAYRRDMAILLTSLRTQIEQSQMSEPSSAVMTKPGSADPDVLLREP